VVRYCSIIIKLSPYNRNVPRVARPDNHERQQDANQKRGLKTSKSRFPEQSLLKLAWSVYHATGASSLFEGPNYTDIKQIFDETKTHHNRLDILYETEQDAALTPKIVR
jgi:hypothetical protein